jgi:CDP-paratose 2-epimerase
VNTPPHSDSAAAHTGHPRAASATSSGGAAPRIVRSGRRLALVVGGAGFIGANLADRLLANGRPVLVLDNLSRPGVERNVEWLCARHGALVRVAVSDIRRPEALRTAIRDASVVYHLAGQVAVTTSLDRPGEDFDVNARGTLNVLEAVRSCAEPPPLLFTSTNKVYGCLSDIALRRTPRYEPEHPELCQHGLSEARPLDFQSPYGCSKGAADQYVLDYARSYGLRTVVFRMSCIYGPRQCGTEDQGWLAHFLRCVLADRPIVLYGDGHQVRDVLFVDDLVDALLLVEQHATRLAGQAFNIGGGPARSVSLREVLALIQKVHGVLPTLASGDWRVGDQRYYVSDIRRFRQLTGWSPRVGVEAGVRRLYSWLVSQGAALDGATALPPMHARLSGLGEAPLAAGL